MMRAEDTCPHSYVFYLRFIYDENGEILTLIASNFDNI